MDWLAGFIEADGSFYILKNVEHGFALGQTYNQSLVKKIHEFLQIKACLKIRNTPSPYALLNTKNKESLFKIANLIKGRMLGIKSFCFAIWLRTLRKNNKVKSVKARTILRKIVSRTL